uniref:hypothetical protein n=1 Tax=Paractinoplanes polyasparticus TaxID=2856853 RepID=UPI001C85992A|nr:hypothetical protein [Actinoplanes polyasparticus]
MTPATIQPLPGGKAVLSFRGVEQTFDNTPAALAEVRKHPWMTAEVLPFPALAPDVLAASPALTS